MNSRIKIYSIDNVMLMYNEYCIEEKGFDERTIYQYANIIENYLNQTSDGNVDLSSNELLTEDKIVNFRQILTGLNVRSALQSLSNFVFEKSYITETLNKITFRNAINNAFPKQSDELVAKSNPTSFLSPNEIRKLFSDVISYNSGEERYTFPLIVGLTYFCLFNQKDIQALKLSDIDLSNKLIRNPRYNEIDFSIPYIQMNDTLFQIINRYMKYRSSLIVQKEHKDNLVIFKGRTIQNGGFSSIFEVINSLAKNRGIIKSGKLNSGILLRSSMLYSLRNSYGSDITNLSKLIGKSLILTEYFKAAFEEFHRNIIESNESIIFVLNGIESNLPKINTKVENLLNWNSEINAYSEDNDIKMEDFEVYDMNIENTQHSNKITIQRLVRDSKIARELKNLYENKCQACNFSIKKSDGTFYSEAHHIQPYNKLHKGDDTPSNMIILCSNCHTQFDDSYYAIEPVSKNIYCVFPDDDKHLKNITLKHNLNDKYLNYAWQLFLLKK